MSKYVYILSFFEYNYLEVEIMKKFILSIFCILVIVFGGLLSYKMFFTDNEEKSTNNPDNNSKIEKSSDEWEKIDIYKEENRDRYINYKDKNKELSNERVVLLVNIGIDQDFYTNVKPALRKDTNLVLTNKFYSLEKDYVPKNLETIDSKYQVGGKMLTHDARVAFEKMAQAARDDGYNIRAVSTYRSYNYQNNLYNNYVNRDGKEQADTYSARPGYSEHQTGLAADIDNNNTSYTSFGLTKEFTWMKENAYKYGFILRYTSENEYITGYKNEPWHYRYVGVDVATKMMKENISSYEEYYFKYLDK